MGTVNAQVESSVVDFSNNKERKALNKDAKKARKASKGKLIIELNEDFDSSRSLSIESNRMSIFDRQVLEDAFYAQGFSIIDLSTRAETYKKTRKERRTDELKDRLGITEEAGVEKETSGIEYQSTYVLRFRSSKKGGNYGETLKSNLTLGIATIKNAVSIFDMKIIDLSQGGKVIATAYYKGKKVKKALFYSSLAFELRKQIENQNK